MEISGSCKRWYIGSTKSPNWAWTKRSSNWEGRILFLTRRPYALLRFPHFCLRWTPVFGYAYAVLTLSLWMTFCAQTRSGSLRTRLFCLQQDSASRRFGRRRWRRGAWASSFQSEVLPSAFCDIDNNIFFVKTSWMDSTTRGLCRASNCSNGFSLGGIVGKWVGKWSTRQLGLTHALRIPYAFLTQITDHWTKTGKIEGTTQTRDAYDWDNRMANLPHSATAIVAFVSLSLRLFATEGRNGKQSQIENTVSN